jgi:hypothetical protein
MCTVAVYPEPSGTTAPDPDQATKTLTRPDVCEARRLRAAELFAQGRGLTEVAEMVGVTYEATRRWRTGESQGPGGARPGSLAAAGQPDSTPTYGPWTGWSRSSRRPPGSGCRASVWRLLIRPTLVRD